MREEIVITVGIPATGKSTAIRPLVDQGYHRVNRDLLGGTLSKSDSPFYNEVRRLHRQGARQFVLDNTYTFKHHRDLVMEVAQELGLPVRVLRLQTSFDQALLFAARRQVERYGELLMAVQYKLPRYKSDPNMFPPQVQYDFQKKLVEPTLDEGFSRIDPVEVKTTWGPEYKHKALILSPEVLQALPNPKEISETYRKMGYKILVASHRNKEIPKGLPMLEYVRELRAIRNQVADLGVYLEGYAEADMAGPRESYWRKPMPGMGALFIWEHKLDPAQCLVVGKSKMDDIFASRCGFQFIKAKDFRC